jgi:hypothetical protein
LSLRFPLDVVVKLVEDRRHVAPVEWLRLAELRPTG